MSDFSVRSDSVDVEQVMRQIRSRIREKRGVDYTEEEIRELANVKLEKFIDPKGVRSGLLEEYRRVSTPEPPAPNFAFGEDTLYETHRGPIRWLRALFRPLLKLLFNPNPLIQALHIQAELNTRNAARAARREQLDALHYEVIHNLVVELTRTGVEVKSLKMRLESMASRLDFDERRARALEGVVQYRAGAVPPLQPPVAQEQGRRDQGPRDQGRRDQGRRDQGPRDHGRDQGRRDQGPRDFGGRPQGGGGAQRPPVPAVETQTPQAQGPGPQAPVPQGSFPPGSSSQGSAPQGSAPQGIPPQGPREPGTENNALDADGNERRARRRRRRGRRRPGDRFGGEGGGSQASPPAEGTSSAPSTADVPPEVAAIRQDFSLDGNAAPEAPRSDPPASAPERSSGEYREVASTSARTSDAPSHGETSPASAPERTSGGHGGPAPNAGSDGGSSEG